MGEQFDGVEETPVQMTCDHIFGNDCIVKWFLAPSDTCPKCRARLIDKGGLKE